MGHETEINPDKLIIMRQKAFEDLEKASTELMRQLYRVRALFPPRSDVWIYIPHSQALLNEINRNIEASKKLVKFI